MTGRRLLAAGCGLLIVAAMGCGGPAAAPLTTYPVSGKVHVKGVGPLKGGTVVFKSQTDPALIIRGQVSPDGSFSLVTRRDDKQFPGAVAGAHEVTVFPPMGDDQSGQPVTLAERFTVKPQENHFTIEVALPTKRP